MTVCPTCGATEWGSATCPECRTFSAAPKYSIVRIAAAKIIATDKYASVGELREALVYTLSLLEISSESEDASTV